MADPPVTREQAVQAFGEMVAHGLLRQARRPAREAALASLGRHATEDAVQEWIARHRP